MEVVVMPKTKEKKTEIPENLQEKLPKHAQDIYKKAHDNALDQYEDPKKRRDDASLEETAHKVAWGAVKNEYEKGDDGKWHKK